MDTPNISQQVPKTSAEQLVPALYVVPTPIGNLRDITLRALDVLDHSDMIYAEDTRVTGKLLQAYGFQTKVARYDEHTHAAVASNIIAAIQAGQKVALVSDAGTPAISDPGQYLVQACRAAGVEVIALPGASAVTTALSGAGLKTDAFCFVGFLPAKTKGRQDVLEQYMARRETLVLFESPHRIEALVADIIAVMGEARVIAVARELTKAFEEYLIGPAQDVAQRLKNHAHVKGEMVVLIEGFDGADQKIDTESVANLLRDALKILSVRDAAQQVAKITGLKKQDVYQQALQLNAQVSRDGD